MFSVGLSGIGFGACSAKGSYTLPALAPALSSLAIISSLAAHWAARRSGWLAASDASVSGGVALAVGCLIGAVLQWAIQVRALQKADLGPFFSCNFGYVPEIHSLEDQLQPSPLLFQLMLVHEFSFTQNSTLPV